MNSVELLYHSADFEKKLVKTKECADFSPLRHKMKLVEGYVITDHPFCFITLKNLKFMQALNCVLKLA